MLFGALHADLYLTFIEEDLIAAVWSDHVMGELRRALKGRHGISGVERRLAQMVAVFGDQVVRSVPDPAFSGLLPDPSDEQVIVDAVRSGCQLLITLNLRDFPADVAARHGLEVQTPDNHLARALGGSPEEFVEVIEAWLARRHRPAYTKPELLARLREVGLPGFAEALAEAFERHR